MSAENSTAAAELPQNRTKNRYTNILPCKCTVICIAADVVLISVCVGVLCVLTYSASQLSVPNWKVTRRNCQRIWSRTDTSTY